MIAKQELLKVKTRALRRNVWFRVLSKIERAIIDLTLKCVERVRSSILETIILSIIDKVLNALESTFLSQAEKVGREVAEKIGRIAQKWGNRNARDWKSDRAFVMLLGVSALNT